MHTYTHTYSDMYFRTTKNHSYPKIRNIYTVVRSLVVKFNCSFFIYFILWKNIVLLLYFFIIIILVVICSNRVCAWLMQIANLSLPLSIVVGPHALRFYSVRLANGNTRCNMRHCRKTKWWRHGRKQQIWLSSIIDIGQPTT